VKTTLRTMVHRIRDRVLRLPRAAIAALAVVMIGVVAVGGVFMFRTYQFVQHDNEFCLSCHLMQDPHERFAMSEHRGLGCKACHQPTMMVRTQMALTQILENPDEIHTHAEVPNRACAQCHIEGDPEKWRIISNSVGHRVHMESDDPSLSGLMCVECHSTSIHKFTAVTQTCAQSGCHEDTQIRLGRMSDLTIHCVGCHDFSRPVSDVAPGEIGVKPLQPRRDECLSCHAMRTMLTDFPVDEPHEAACGACHNPHDQETPRQAQRTCATGGCHEQPETSTPLHRGLAVGVLQDCLACHPAHEFRVVGENCLGCHSTIFQDRPLTPRPAAGRAPDAAPITATPETRTGISGRLGRLLGREPEAPRVTVQAARGVRRLDLPFEFSHNRHRNVECVQCHVSDQTHGALTITSVRGCRECHHTGPQVAQQCTNCHTQAEIQGQLHRVSAPVRLTAGNRTAMRQLPFNHRQHTQTACVNCHTEPLTRAVTQNCTGCHAEHHRPAATCMNCHARPPADAHDLNSHLTCSGSGCHIELPFQGVPRTRNACLSCHQDLVRHEPGQECVRCHVLPAPRAAAATGAPRPTLAGPNGGHP
jgi:hypothetical protein